MPENTLPEIGKIIAVNGEAYAESSAGLRPLEAGSPVFEGEELVTSSGSNLEVRFADDTLLSQGSDSRISLDDYAFDPSGDTASDYFVSITEGTFRMVTGKIAEQNPERFQVGSPLATIGIRGTTTIHEVRPGQGEKHGVEEIHSGKALIVQSVDGQIRQIAQSQGIVDVASSGALSPVRSLSTQELNSFREIAPASIQHEQEIRQDRKEEEEEEKQDTEDTEENAEESQEESENNDESEEGETTDGEGEAIEGEGAEGEAAEEPVEGEGAEGEAAEEPVEGEGAEGEAAEGEPVEGEGAEGESTEGESVEGGGTEGETAEGETAESDAAEQENGQEEADGPRSEAEAEAEAEETGRPQEGENPAQADNNAEENANAEQPPEDGVPVETAQDQSGETQISQETGTTENNGPDSASETGNSPGTGSSPDAGLGGAGGETQGPIVADMGTGEGSGPENGMQTPGDPEGLPSDINPGGGDSEGNIGSVIDPGRGIVSGGESGALANQKDYDSSKVKGETQKIGDENKPDNDDSSPAEGGPEVGGETSGGDQQDEGGESEGSTTGDTIGGTTGTGLDALAGTGGLPGTTNDFSSPTSVTPVNPTGTGTTPAPSTSDDEDLLPEDTGTGTDTTPEPDQGDTSGSSEPVDPIIYGTAGNDYLPGTSASDTISALPGDDILEGMAGDDTLQGGDGIDLTSYISSDSGVEVDLESGTSSGGQGNDSLVSIEGIIGSNHNDTLTGSLSADNTFEGGFGEDYIDGKGGTNTASYRFADGAEVNLASETASATHEDGYITYESTLKNISNLIGSEGSDSFTGDSGANTFYDIDGAFSDSYDGSGGTDTLSYRLLEGDTGVNAAGNNITAGAGDDSFTGIEKIEGSQYADTLTGGTGVSTLSGYMGNDTLTGTPGTGMVLNGDCGNDTIISGQNSNSISGGNDVDLLKYDTSGTVVINTNSAPGEGTATHENGTDTFTEIESYLTGSGDDTIIGSTADETFDGGAGTDTISYSGAGSGVTVNLSDTVAQSTGQGTDTLLNIENIEGSGQADTLTAATSGSTLSGNGGDDTLTGLGGNDLLYGISGNNVLNGGAGDDSIVGADGDDTITGGAGNDVLDGGAGNDTFVFSELGGTSVVAEAINNFSSADDTLEFSGTNYSQSAGFGTYAGTYSGESANIGTDPAFVLDTFGHLWYDENGDASGGHHFITREMGASVTAADITVDGAAIDGVGLTQTGTSAAETFTGSTGNDYFSGMGGNDVFYDGSGDDSISGGTGDDFIYAGYGNDSYDGGDGLDTVSFEESSGGVVFSLGGAAASGSSPDKITAHFEAVKGSDHGDSLFGGDGDSTLLGGDGNDFLQSFGGNDTIKDGAGDDTVYAGDGNDFIFAGDGFDTYDGGDGIDTLSFEDSSAGVTGSFGISSNSSGSKTSTNFEVIKGSAYADNLTSSVALSLFGLDGNDSITGSLGSDALLSGDAGDDSITGDWGDDTIWGGEGADTLDGGAGQDVFIYSSLGTATVTGEQINNFSAADDKIYFKSTLYDPSASFSSFGGDYDGEDGVFGNTQPGFVFDASNRLWYDDNGDSAGGLHFVANISGDAVTDANLILDPEMTQLGTAGDDTISGSIGNDFLSGLGGNDTLYGHAGSDSLIGGAGNDYIVPGSGVDVIDGGEGFDTLSFEDLTEGIIFSLNVGGGVGGDLIASNSSSPGGIIASNADVRKTATSFEKLKGTAYDDKLGAGLTAGTLFGLDGNDQLYGSDENDYLSGDDGNDSIFGGDGDDTIIGGAGEDFLNGGAGQDIFQYSELGISTANAEMINNFSSTDDTINFSSTNYNQASGFEIYAGSYTGSATILGAEPGFVFDGDGKLWYDDNGNTAGGQHFVANISGDTVTADDITVDGAAIEGAGMTETGTSGDDTLSGGTGNDTISGLAGDDTIYGAAGNDTIYGGEDSDWIDGGVGSNYLDGGGGERDGLSYQASDSGITMNVSDNSVTHGTTPGVDTITGFEGYEGSSHDDTITGSSNNERFFASTGNDTYDGNGGRDALTYEKIGSSIQVDLTAGTATGASGNDSFSNFNYIIGTDQADTITATSGDMLDYTVEGGKGDDILTGGDLPTDKLVYINAEGSVTVNLSDGTSTGADGNDTISGFGVVEGSMHDDHITGDGNMNQLRGNAGDDTLDGGGGDDMVDYMQASAGVYVNLADGTATGGDGNDTLLNFENVIGSTDYNDTIIGNSGDNHFTDHGETDDTYTGNGGTDAVYYQNLSSGITVDLVAGTVTGGSGNDKLFDIEAVYGSSHNDIITGGASLSTLSGGEGSDIITAGSGGANITGGIGDDTLIAGSGSDKFFYNSSSEIGDTISGFDSGTDSLEFNLGFFDSTALFKTVTATYDGSNGTIGSTDSTFVYDSANHQLWYDSNGDDAGGEELIATFDGGDHVQVDDIHVNGSALNPTATTINGTSGKDDIIATSADNVIYGKEESDEIFGMEGDDTIYGELGEDVLSGGLGNDYLNGGTSDGDVDRLLYYNAPSGVNVNLADGTTTGGDGNDTFVEIEGVIGSKFADTLTGDGNDNIFWITEGDDTIDGAAGTDMISYEIASGSVTVNLGDGTATGAMGNDIFSGIENVEGSKNYTDYITGSSGDNVFYDDASTDSYQGGAGTDIISFEGLDSGVAANLTNSFAGGGAGGDIIGGMENIIGSRYDDTITGDSGNNKFWGLEGNDTIDGAGGIDAISYEKSGSVTVNLATSVATGSNGTDTLSNIENVIGSDYGDTITGDSGDNVFRDGGATAADSYDGGGGTDTLHYKDMAVKITADFQFGTVDMDSGPTDNFSNIEIILGTAYDDTFVSGNITDDTMHGEAGNDILSFINATSGVNINVGSGTATGGCGSDVFSGFESFIGSDYADTFTGSATGSETLYGGEGADVFNPTGSASTIRYDNVSEGGDTVNGFSSGVDSFSFSSANFDSGAGFSDGATVDGSTSAYFIFDGTTLSYDADGDGAGAAENIAEVTGENVIKTDISFF